MTKRVQVAGDDGRILLGVDDEDSASGLDRRQGSAAAVEEHEVGAELDRQLRTGVHVRREHGSGEPAAAATAADRRHSGERRRLEVVGGGVATGARELEQRVEVRRDLHQLRLRRPAPTHRDDDDGAVTRQKLRGVSGDRRLPNALAGADDSERGQRERLERRRLEAEVGAHVRQPSREHAARQPEPLRRPEHGLVREVDDDLGSVVVERAVELGRKRHAVVGTLAELLRPAEQVRRDEVVGELLERSAHHGGVVLSVDEGQSALRHEREVTSSSIRPVYFSYSNVSSENWMIRSCPWKGCLRQTATCEPETSTTL